MSPDGESTEVDGPANRVEASAGERMLVASPPTGGLDSGIAQLDTLATLLTGNPARRATSRHTIRHSRLSCAVSVAHAIGSALQPGFRNPAVVVRGQFIPAYRGGFSVEPVGGRIEALRRTTGGLRGIVLHDGRLTALLDGLGLDPDSRPTGLLSDNETLVLFARRGGCDVVIHVGGRGRPDEIRRHREGLLLAGALLSGRLEIPLPSIQGSGDFAGHEFLIQSRLPGSTDTRSTDLTLAAAEEILRQMQAATRSDSPVDELRFLENEAEILCNSMPAEALGPVSRLVALVRERLRRETPHGSLVHGDFWAGNILFGRGGTVSGIIDWGWARRSGVALLDTLHLLASARARAAGRSRASALAAIVNDEAGEATAQAVRRSLGFHGLAREHLSLTARLLVLRWVWQGYCLTWSGGTPWLSSLLRDAQIRA